jgi:hypothetical protein
MDRNVQRRNPFRHDSFEVKLSESSECREISVEKRKPIIVVFEVERFTQIGRQLIDKAELAMVIAGSDLVEQCRVDLGAKGFTRLFLDFERNLEPTPINIEAEFPLIGKESIRDDVAGHLAIEPKNQVAGQ